MTHVMLWSVLGSMLYVLIGAILMIGWGPFLTWLLHHESPWVQPPLSLLIWPAILLWFFLSKTGDWLREPEEGRPEREPEHWGSE